MRLLFTPKENKGGISMVMIFFASVTIKKTVLEQNIFMLELLENAKADCVSNTLTPRLSIIQNRA